MITLGDLWRQTGLYTESLAITHHADDLIASDQQIADANIFSAIDSKDRGFNYWLTLILCRDNRIAFTPFDEEEIDT